jgi:hypothetical protein
MANSIKKKRTSNIYGFIGDSLDDKYFIENNENIPISGFVLDNAPKRSNAPLTSLSTKNKLNMILNISKNMDI